MDVVLACGPGGRALAAGLASRLVGDADDASAGPGTPGLTIVAGSAEDITLCGLRFCPDLDALSRIPALREDTREEASTGADAQTRAVSGALARWGALPDWFAPDDLDVARAIARSRWLAAGATPTEISARLTPPRTGIHLRPMSDTPIESHVVVEEGDERLAVHALEWVSTQGGEGDGCLPFRKHALPRTSTMRCSVSGQV